MGQKQSEFVQLFSARFKDRFDGQMLWGGGQVPDNKAAFKQLPQYRRDGILRKNEGIELGDLTGLFRGVTVVVEYDSGGLDLQNLMKYWPFLRGELSSSPPNRIVLCHFSSWESYGSAVMSGLGC